MFGDNPKRAAIHDDGNKLQIKSIFKTLQGEGVFTGTPAIFIRLGGCNLACTFCDTDFEDFITQTKQDIIEQVDSLSRNTHGQQVVNLVVITGGEPLRQPVELLCQDLLARGFAVQIETNGTLYRPLPSDVYIICSPKAGNKGYHKIREDLLTRISALKFLVSKHKDHYHEVPELGQTQYEIPVFVQPMDEYDAILNAENAALAVQIALERGYRLSYQLHKVLGIE